MQKPPSNELLEAKQGSATGLTEDDHVWLGLVPGQRLPPNFVDMDANALRLLFIISMVPMDVFSAATDYFDGNEQSAIHWLCSAAIALGGQRPVDVCKTEEGQQAVLKLIGQLNYGILS